jgi:uncharacterized membrane protein
MDGTVGVGLRTNPEIRAAALKKLRGRWTNPILVVLISGLIMGVAGSIRDIGFVLSLLLGGPFMLGAVNFFVKFNRGEEALVDDLFAGFQRYTPATVLYLLMVLFTVLWSLLFIIPGIVAGLSYSMAFYVLRDHPEIQPREALRLSSRMMMGHKMQLFLLFLSFTGWAILAILTMGIGFLWLGPYVSLAVAGFYEDLVHASA